MVIKFNAELYSVVSFVHRTPGNLRAFVQVKMRGLKSGAFAEHRFASTDSVEKISLDDQDMEFLYKDGTDYHFMNVENYEQIHLSEELLGDNVNYLTPQLKVKVTFFEERPISIELPAAIIMTVMETEPGLKSASVSNVGKPATMETGLVVTVPPFINQGEKIRVSTTDGEYLERA